MGRRQGKQAKITGGFVPLTWKLLNSRAYRNLPVSASKALPFFLGKPHVPYGNTMLFEVVFDFSYREANRCLGYSNSTFHKVICDLMSLGFIDPVDKGGLRGEGRSCSQFRVSPRWEQYGTKAFKEVRWKEFKPK
jgi:hypothetical protein